MPWPSGLVVKNGSKILSRIAGSMPLPVSITWISTPSGTGLLPHGHLAAFRAGVDGVGDQVEHHLVDLRRVARHRRQRGQVGLHLHLVLLGPAADDVERRVDAGVQIDLLQVALVEAGEVAQVLDDLLNPLAARRASGRAALPGCRACRPGRSARRARGCAAAARPGFRRARLPPPGTGGAGRAAASTSRWSTATLLMTNASGLLISWATPATIWPRAASFSDCTSWLWAFFSSSCAAALRRRRRSAGGQPAQVGGQLVRAADWSGPARPPSAVAPPRHAGDR